MSLLEQTANDLHFNLKGIAAANTSHVMAEQATVNGFYIKDEKILKASKLGFEKVSEQFAALINVVFVGERTGESQLGCLGDPASSRTDVTKHDRKTNPLLAMPMEYRTAKMNTDIHIPYATLNAWSLKKSMNALYGEFVFLRLALDRLTVGWHGVSDTAADTDPVSDPLLTNVAKGWLQNIREQHPEQTYGDETNFITIDPTGTGDSNFKNLDQVVVELVSQIPNSFRDNLICLIGDKLIQAERKRIYNDGTIEKFKTADTFQMFGGIPRVECPCLPSDAVIVTSADNLSIYIKTGASFRQMTHNPKRERTEDYQTHEIAFVVENARKFTAFTNIAIAGEAPEATSFHNKVSANAAH